MFHHLKGLLVSADSSTAVVECAGVGYFLRIPLTTFEVLPPIGTEVTINTHLCVREDAMDLYGFATALERTTFRQLISVSGVGPVAALAIIANLGPVELIAAIKSDDPKPITKAKGIGKKTAERIILDLKNKITELEALAGPRAVKSTIKTSDKPDAEFTTALALGTLGYSEAIAAEAAAEAVKELGEDAELNVLLRRALASFRR